MTSPFPDDGRIRVAVLTGGHNFEVPQFHHLFREMDGVDAYIQSIENWAGDDARVRESYDVVVFYTMHITDPPSPELPWPEDSVREALEALGSTSQGIVVWHHALVSYPEWDFWSDLVGIAARKDFDYTHDVTCKAQIVDTSHPITEGLSPFDIVDETYTLEEPREGVHTLLTVDHEASMHAVAWVHEFRQSRVFCLQLGHDSAAWKNESFRRLFKQGISWCARLD